MGNALLLFVIKNSGRSKSTKAGVDLLNRHQNEEHLHTVAEWLSTSDYPSQQTDLFNQCQEGAGQWLFHLKEFQAWLDGTESTLFCPDIPGAGKTMITSIMINNLQQRFQGDKKVGIAYVYCNYKRQTEQTIHHFMASLLKKPVQQQPNLPESTDKSIVHGLARAFIVMDALDECTDTNKPRSILLEEIANLQVQLNTHFFAISRFIPDITAKFRDVATLEIRATDADVQAYLENKISETPVRVSRNRALQEKTRAEEGKPAAGMLSDKVTAKDVKIALRDVLKGSGALEITYTQALERIKGQKPGFRRLAEAVLSWTVCAQRQLTI
ncbi:hypothetical protein HO133_007725 [Letharia lupina]|uniref:Nephrocystin 3-like N-terminal domain-containing protein n=1 Tax=Letharia lupina TaxID=560253 RepID=A0A8H6CR01_9LECA|nr:uncharacterized protein HO133_007725 [Letharia lupina]KAF6227997.1 hypothetical protein HO133_007725 [Letharia lupina]